MASFQRLAEDRSGAERQSRAIKLGLISKFGTAGDGFRGFLFFVLVVRHCSSWEEIACDVLFNGDTYRVTTAAAAPASPSRP